MARMSVLAAGAAVFAGAAFVTGASSVPPAKPPDTVKPVIVNKTLYFNMAAVMRDYKKAKDSIARMNQDKTRYDRDTQAMYAMHLDLQHVRDKMKKESPDHPRLAEVEAEFSAFLRLRQKFEERANRESNDEASRMISGFHEEISDAVRAIAREQGAVAVLAYPDAVTPEEKNNPYLKELKLKPPAALPFYLDPSVDCTAEVIKRINIK